MFVPDDRQGDLTPWQSERDLLTAWLENVEDPTVPEAEFQERVAAIRRGRDDQQRGLIDELFWTAAADNAPLRLRNNFAFFLFEHDARRVSQADVYFVICAILHALREGKMGKLRQGTHTRVVLAPRSFFRFNDGVIQASLLRAARPVELDYSVADEQSHAMAEVLTSIFGNIDNPAGEAAIEFLLAMASGKLRLIPRDTEAVIGDMRKRELDSHPVVRFLCQEILKQYGPPSGGSTPTDVPSGNASPAHESAGE